jgi:cysteinyl-tRNA synthetase
MSYRLGQLVESRTTPLTMRRGNSNLSTRVKSAASLSADASSKDKAKGAGGGEFTLYNTKTRRKEVFMPRQTEASTDLPVSMYVCGVTVYDYSHIGHARVYTVFDVLYRYLLYLKHDVIYCRNFTDIDDKIIKRANETSQDTGEVTRRFIAEFQTDMVALGNLPPTLEPKATEHIADMIDQIEKIIENGHAYAVDGDVYFHVPSLEGYGSLSGRRQEDNRAGERVDVDSKKRDAADFALWKAKKEGEPSWPSPWGEGRPGWHIECSAMIHKLLGEQIDIHGGGQDLTFPHHENELAQSMACCDQDSDTFSRWWVHNGFVNVNTEKMSKSLGNFFTIRDVLEKYDARALRFFLLNTHYRSSINFSDSLLDEASARCYYLYQTIVDCMAVLAEAEGVDPPLPSLEDCKAHKESKNMLQDAIRAMSDDLGTQQALATLSPVLKSMNEFLHTKKGRKNPKRLEALKGCYSGVSEVLAMLGLDSKDYKGILVSLKASALRRCGRTAEEVEEVIRMRQEARKNKDFGKSDQLREELMDQGIALLDTPQGTEWRPVSIVN